MVECAKIVEGNIVSFACDLDQGHAGPCRAKENPRSVRERAKWEEEQRILAGEPSDAQRTISGFHGQPQTTAERYTVNPTPVPKTREEIIAEQQAEAAQQVGAGFHGSTESTLGSSSQIEQDWIEEQAREEAEEDAWRDEFGVPSEFSGEVYYDEEEDAFFRVEDSQPVEQEYVAPARMTQE